MPKSPCWDRGGGSGGGTHREDGDEDACSTQHRIVDGFHILLRVPDAVVVAVEAPLVGLDCACLDDEERQPGYKERETTKPISNTGKKKQFTKNPQDSIENPLQTTHHHSWLFSFHTVIFPKGTALGFVFPSCSCREQASPLLWLSDVCAAWFQLSPVRCKY